MNDLEEKLTDIYSRIAVNEIDLNTAITQLKKAFKDAGYENFEAKWRELNPTGAVIFQRDEDGTVRVFTKEEN